MNNRRRQVSTIVIALLMVGLVIGVAPTCYATEPPYNETGAKEFDPEDLPWSNETDVFILEAPPLPPFFSYFNITPTEIELGEDLIISFVIRNPNNRTFNWMSTTRIGDITQIIEIDLEAYESKVIWYRIIPHVARGYHVWIDGQTGDFNVTTTTHEPDPLEELSAKIDRIDAELVNLQDGIGWGFNVTGDMIATLLDGGLEMDGRIDVLENEISRLQNTIVYACIATAIIAILGAFLLIKRVR